MNSWTLLASSVFALSIALVNSNANAAVYTFNVSVDPSTAIMNTHFGLVQEVSLIAIVPPTDNPGDQYIINVTFDAPVHVSGSRSLSEVYAGFADPQSILANNPADAFESEMTTAFGYVGPANPTTSGSSFNAGYYGAVQIFGANPGFSVTGFDTTITVGTQDPLPLVQLVVGAGADVPEPATWAMILVGFGGLGAALRSRRRPFERLSEQPASEGDGDSVRGPAGQRA